MTNAMRNNRTGKIKTKKLRVQDIWLYSVLGILIIGAVYGLVTMETKGVDLGEAALQTLSYFGTMFIKPQGVPSHFGAPDGNTALTILEALKLLGITLSLAFLTTLIGGITALVLGIFAARNLTSERVSNIIKSCVAVVRAVPTVLWVLIFAIGAGLGSVAAVIGMSFHTVGYLLKAYSESFEEIDEGTIEALRASGATWIQIIFQAVIPSSLTYLLSWTFIRFEINFAVSVAMGAAAGAGGIGFQLFMAAGYFFNIREIGFITYFILAVALLMEYGATILKSRYNINET